MQQQWIILTTFLWKIITLICTFEFISSFLQNFFFLITNIRKILSMTFTRFTPAILLIWFLYLTAYSK